MSVWRPDSWAMKGYRPWPAILLRLALSPILIPLYAAGKMAEWFEERLP